MKFNNPWIDPRIVNVRTEDIQTYLTRHGWQSVGSASNPAFLRYERVGAAEDFPTLFVPARNEEDGSALQWKIDVVADVARFEERWAVAVLCDMMKASDTPVGSVGNNIIAPVEPAM